MKIRIQLCHSSIRRKGQNFPDYVIRLLHFNIIDIFRQENTGYYENPAIRF